MNAQPAYQVQTRRIGPDRYQFETTNADGETVSVVEMNRAKALALGLVTA